MTIRRRKRIPISVPIASMADIAFLLIIFFILVSDIKDVELKPPASADIAPIRPASVVVTLDRDGVLRVQGRTVPVEALEDEIAYVLESKRNKVVMLKVDKDVSEDKYGPVLMALGTVTDKIQLVGKRIKE